MDDDLSSLCTICHIEPPIYTCPRCFLPTCSLDCAKRHKIRSMCDGIRDPTVYRPISEVATPWGLDHDYNFLHGIETRISRSEKVLIEDLELVTKQELERARAGETEEAHARRTGKKIRELPGQACVERVLTEESIRLIKAPKGMRRNKENATNWHRKHKQINWQVEWIRERGQRTLYRALGSRPIGDFYDAMCEEERRLRMSDEERRAERKELRKGREGGKEPVVKKARFAKDTGHLTTTPLLQSPETGAWNLTPFYPTLDGDSEIQARTQVPAPSIPKPKTWTHKFYLHRPLTPASFPKVLAPISPSKPLTELLRHRDVLEFPTIYVLPCTAESLPKEFMLESEFLKAMDNRPKRGTDTKMRRADDSSSSEESSSEESGSDVSMEEGEAV
ncbi:hypothetical protein BUE80_DR010438 [Diplocarpon rosae]|nr:hypothetical protein BUE80_DR010438 [Diplocarpon rosae]